MRNTALRMSISWIMYATPSSRSYAKTCPRAFWTKTGRHLLPLLLRYKQRAAQLTNMYMNWVCRVINSNLHCQFCGALQASEHLRRLHMRNMVMKYCKRVQPEWKKQVYWLQNAWSHFLFLFLWTCIFFILLDFFSLLQMMQKVVASEIFKDQKDSYPQSVGRLFLDSRLGTCSYTVHTIAKFTSVHLQQRCTKKIRNIYSPFALFRTWANQS